MDWGDVEPVPQDDGPNPVATIAYAPEFSRLMGLFRAVLRSGEKSPRVVALTREILDYNAANYTVWQYRRECLYALDMDLNVELNFMDEFASENPKNYQIWHHRRAIVEKLGDGSRELAFSGTVFIEDGKNYHAWAHRQWAVKTYNLWEGELDFITQLMQEDVRNNSVWNHRWFVVHCAPNRPPLETEVEYAFTNLEGVQLNESAWNYIRGLARQHPELKSLVKDRCKTMLAVSTSENPFLMSLYADLCEWEGTKESFEEAQGYFVRLKDADQIRAKHWGRRAEKAAMAVESM